MSGVWGQTRQVVFQAASHETKGIWWCVLEHKECVGSEPHAPIKHLGIFLCHGFMIFCCFPCVRCIKTAFIKEFSVNSILLWMKVVPTMWYAFFEKVYHMVKKAYHKVMCYAYVYQLLNTIYYSMWYAINHGIITDKIYTDGTVTLFCVSRYLGKCVYSGGVVAPCVTIPSRTWKPGKLGDLSFFCPGPEMAWNLPQKVRENLDKTRNLAENLEC